MDKIDKIIQTIKNSRQPVRFKDLSLLLHRAGYTLVRHRGSHVHFFKDHAVPIRFPVHNNAVKSVYARSILHLLGL